VERTTAREPPPSATTGSPVPVVVSLAVLPLLLYGLVAYNDWLLAPWVILCALWLWRGRTET